MTTRLDDRLHYALIDKIWNRVRCNDLQLVGPSVREHFRVGCSWASINMEIYDQTYRYVRARVRDQLVARLREIR